VGTTDQWPSPPLDFGTDKESVGAHIETTPLWSDRSGVPIVAAGISPPMADLPKNPFGIQSMARMRNSISFKNK
jgi:hypothetical protein